MWCAQEIDAGIANEQHIIQRGGLCVIGQRLKSRAQAAFGEQYAEEVDAGEASGVTMDGFDGFEWLAVGKKYAGHRAVGSYGNSIKDFVAFVQ